VGAHPRGAGAGDGVVGGDLGVRPGSGAGAVPPQRGGDVRAVVEHGDPQQRGEREDRGHLRAPAGHPDRERPRPALPPRDPHRRRAGPDRIGRARGWGGFRERGLLYFPGPVVRLIRRLRGGQAAFLRSARLPRRLFMKAGHALQRGGAEDKRGGWGPRRVRDGREECVWRGVVTCELSSKWARDG